MQNYRVTLEQPPSNSFRCIKAANSVDLDLSRKLRHEFNVDAELDTPYNVGLIVGASGSGKSTLARKIFGDAFEHPVLCRDASIIDQLPEEFSYDDCVNVLTAIGLSQVPCWVRNVGTLSNGQQARADCIVRMAKLPDPIVIDEWTSVVDRNVARVMSHTVQKFARSNNRRVVLLSCHYDVLEWLDPDWVIDCNTQTFIDRRLLQPGERKRTEHLHFEIAHVDKATWKNFSRYHYLSEILPGGLNFYFGLFHNDQQIGFQAFSEYVPRRIKDHKKIILHSNRVVVHPDYVGFGLGLRLVDACSAIMVERGFRIMAKFSSIPLLKSRLKSSKWVMKSEQIFTAKPSSNMDRKKGFRQKVKTWSFEFVG